MTVEAKKLPAREKINPDPFKANSKRNRTIPHPKRGNISPTTGIPIREGIVRATKRALTKGLNDLRVVRVTKRALINGLNDLKVVRATKRALTKGLNDLRVVRVTKRALINGLNELMIVAEIREEGS
jgi:hypothetical protein